MYFDSIAIMVFPQWVLAVDRLDEETLRRCTEALGEYQRLKSWAPCRFILMGGFFHPKDVQQRPASHLLRQWFVEHGVPEEDIVCEETSVDTFENIEHGLQAFVRRFNRAVLDHTDIRVVSEKHHVRRIRWTLRWAHGLQSVDSSHDVVLRGKDALREWAFYFVHVLTHPIPFLGFLGAYSRRKRRLLADGK